MTFVKICGITRIEDAQAVAAAGADALGFVFWPNSPRYVTPHAARAISAAIPSSVRRIGVFVDETPGEIEKAVRTVGLDIVQLHGAERADIARQLPRPVWRAVHGGSVPASLRGYPASAFVVDGAPAGTYGGAGIAPGEDRILATAALGPLVLAGGLDPPGVGAAIARYRPYAVDVSSGVETAPGIKDGTLVRAFVALVRQSDRRLVSQRKRSATVPRSSPSNRPLIDHFNA